MGEYGCGASMWWSAVYGHNIIIIRVRMSYQVTAPHKPSLYSIILHPPPSTHLCSCVVEMQAMVPGWTVPHIVPAHPRKFEHERKRRVHVPARVVVLLRENCTCGEWVGGCECWDECVHKFGSRRRLD